MYTISDSTIRSAVYSALEEQVREPFNNRISIGEWDNKTFKSSYTITSIRNITITQNACNNTEISIGGFPAQELSVEFDSLSSMVSSGYVYKDKIIFVECGVCYKDSSENLKYCYVPMGYFQVEQSETDNDGVTVKITARDMGYYWGDTYTGSTSDTTAKAQIDSFAASKGISVVYGKSYTSYVSTLLSNIDVTAKNYAILSKLNAMTQKEAIAELAGIVGCNARLNTENKLYIGFFPDNNLTISSNVQWQNGFKKTADSVFTVQSITSNDNDGDKESFTAGTGEGITFANGIISNARITTIKNRYAGNISYMPCEIDWRGNPCVEAGDSITAEYKGNTYKVYISSQTIDLCGGLAMTSVCPLGNSEINFDDKSYTDAKISQVKTAYQTVITEATQKINGSNGGYVHINDTDNDGNPDEILITETESGTTGNVVKINKDGIGYGTSGTSGLFTTAITGEGISANAITTGSISADIINLSVNQSGVTIGQGYITGLTDDLATILSKANNAETNASKASTAVASWAYSTNTTYIDGSKIYTGTITAEQLNVGWQSGNLASSSSWTNPNYDDPDYIKFKTDDDGTLRCYIAKDFGSGISKKVYSAPFYMAKGAQYQMSATFAASINNFWLKLQYSSSIGGTYSDVDKAYIYKSSGTTISSCSVDIQNSGYYRIMAIGTAESKDNYVKNIYARYDVTGNMIVNGKITSVDGKTYFDLNNSELVTDTGTQKVQFANGAIDFYSRKTETDDYALRATIVNAIWTDDKKKNHQNLGLYYQDGGASCISFGKRNADKDFNDAMSVYYNDGSPYVNMELTEMKSDDSTTSAGFATYKTTRTVSGTKYVCQFGVGLSADASKKCTASLELIEPSADKPIARIDVANRGANCLSIRGNYDGNTTPWLDLMKSGINYNSRPVLIEPTDGSNWWIGGGKVCTGLNFDDFLSGRAGNLKIKIGETVYSCYWSK